VILPIAFPNLDWSKYLHVELLASKTNFIVHAADTIPANADAREQTFRVLLESVYNTLTAMNVKLSEENVTKINSTIRGSGKRARSASVAESQAVVTTKSSGEDLVESLSFYLHKSLDLHRQLASFMKQQQQQAQSELQGDVMKEYHLKKRYFGTSVKTFIEQGIEQRSWFSGELTFTIGEALSSTTNKLDAVITWQNLRQSLTPQDARTSGNWSKLPVGLKQVMEFLLDSVGHHWEWKLCGTFDKPTGEIELHVVSVPKAIIFSATSITKFLVSKSGDKLEGYFFDGPDSFKGQGSFRFTAF